MYFNSKRHILSNAILFASFVRFADAALSVIARFMIRKGGIDPDMSDDVLWNIQTILAMLMIAATAAIFYFAIRKINRLFLVIPEEDRRGMAALQEDVFGGKKSALTAEVTKKLLQIWFAILVGAQFMYEISSEIYRRFAMDLEKAVGYAEGASSTNYVYFYNLTHGFKYQGMLIALLLGVVMTAIFLNDRMLKIMVPVIAVFFLVSTAGLDMATVSIMGHSIGVVWSSVFFHVVDTAGLVALAWYLRKHYRGV